MAEFVMAADSFALFAEDLGVGHHPRALCMVSWDRRTGRSCPEHATYRLWWTGADAPTLLCPEHTAMWRSASNSTEGVERITTL